jgi:hypothetical protein
MPMMDFKSGLSRRHTRGAEVPALTTEAGSSRLPEGYQAYFSRLPNASACFSRLGIPAAGLSLRRAPVAPVEALFDDDASVMNQRILAYLRKVQSLDRPATSLGG